VSRLKISLRLLTPAPPSLTSLRRTFPGRHHCREPVRARTSLRAIALRFLRTTGAHFTAFADSAPIGLRYFFFFLVRISRRPNRTYQRVLGGRGRIRTSVARKERQIYSLLVLATHPPVLEKFVPQAKCKSSKHLSENAEVSKRKHKTDSCQKTPARRFCF
jgi:hypothetical protein